MVTKYSKIIFFLWLIVVVSVSFLGVRFLKNSDTNILALFPKKSRSVIDFEKRKNRMDFHETLVLVLSIKPEQALTLKHQFREDTYRLMKHLESSLGSRIQTIQTDAKSEIAYFKGMYPLILPIDTIQRALEKIQNHRPHPLSASEVNKKVHAKDFQSKMMTGLFDELSDMRVLLKVQGSAAKWARFPDGEFVSEDGSKRVILVRLHTDNHRWIQEVQEVLAQSRQAVQESQLMPEIQVQFAGSVQESLEDRESFFGDIKLSIILVSIFLSLLLWAYFKSFKICFYLLLSSVGSIFLTLASGYLFFHQATLQTGMIISVVAGNGVNFGILIAGRLKKGESWKRALPGMAASLLTICLGYVSCALTDFKGLQQFGILGMMGMVFSFISAIIVFGAAYSADAESKDQSSETVNPEIGFADRQDEAKWKPFFTSVRIKNINRLGVGFLFVLFLLGGYQIQRHGWVESDLSKLRDEKSLTHGALAVSKNVITPFFGQSLVPLQILVSDVRKMVPAMNGLYELIREHPEYGRQIRQIYTIYSVLPTDQEKKYELLSQIKKYELTAQPSWIRNFDLKTLQVPVRFENVPVSVKKLFVEKDGMSDRTILLDLTEDGDRWNTDLIIRFAHDLRTKLDKIDSDVLIQARYLYTADLIRAVKEQGTLTTLFTFILVLLSVFIFTGNGFKVIIPSLVLGCLFLMVSFFALGLTLNPINFLTLPITIGIAADYSINLYFGLKGRDRTQSYSVIQDVICCSLTTIIGYGSMLFSSNLGLRSFSIAAVLGEITCCLIAVWWVGVWAPSKAN